MSPKVVKYDSEAFTVTAVTADAKKKLFENYEPFSFMTLLRSIDKTDMWEELLYVFPLKRSLKRVEV